MNDPGSQNVEGFRPSVEPGLAGCLFWLFVFSQISSHLN